MEAYNKYIEYDDRLWSFEGWPHAEPRAEAVAAAGFFFQPDKTNNNNITVSTNGDGTTVTSTDDTVRCPCCDKVCSGFTPENAWDLLAHSADCPFKRNIKSAKQRLCRDCDIFFSSIGAKLNHSKRVHPRPEEERAERRRERQAAVERRQLKVKKVRKARAAAAASSAVATAAMTTEVAAATARARSIAVAALDLRVHRSEAAPAPVIGWKPINQQYIEGNNDIEEKDDECIAVVEPQQEQQQPEHGLSMSRLMVVVDSEPCAWAGEIVMSRAEYREFRQHFRAMTHIFRDVDPRKRAW